MREMDLVDVLKNMAATCRNVTPQIYQVIFKILLPSIGDLRQFI
jgi:hypothetical protein